MSKYRPPSKKSEWYLPKETYLTVVHYAKQYPVLLAEYNVLADTAGTIRYDKDKVQTSDNYDSTFETAVKLTEIGEKIHRIEDALELSAPTKTFRKYLILSVCNGLTLYQLRNRGLKCKNKTFSDMRSRFYFELSKKI